MSERQVHLFRRGTGGSGEKKPSTLARAGSALGSYAAPHAKDASDAVLRKVAEEIIAPAFNKGLDKLKKKLNLDKKPEPAPEPAPDAEHAEATSVN